MEPTSAKVRSLSFDSQVFGQPQPWAVHHRGVEQEGEVIVAERVNPAWGRRPEGGLGFRLVFFTVPRRISSVRIEDPRIAMAVPRRSPLQVRPSLDSEIKAIHEARARYVTARDPDALALRRSMEEREVSVRGELARQFAVSFAQGRIYTYPGVSVRPRDIFEGDTPEAWADRLASAVLSLAYPSPLFDHSSFPYSLTADGVSAVYRGLFHGDADAVDMVEAFGPGLGLTRPDAPSRFDASECRAVDVVLRLLEARGGEMPAEEVLRELTDGHGIVRPLALLYLLAFVRQARGQVTLEPDHEAVSRRGGPFLADRITWDLVSEVSFSGSLADHLGTVRLRPAVTWDTVLPYASLVVDGLEPAEDPERVSLQERRLLDALGTLRSQASHAREALGMLEPYLGRAPRGALEASDRLEALCEPAGYREFYSEAQQRFQGPSGFAETLEVHRRLVQLADHAPAMAETKRYLDSMTFGQDH